MATVDRYEILTYDELLNAIENDSTHNDIKALANLLLSAVTDWPTLNLQEPKDLVAELKKEIKNSLTFNYLDQYLKSLKSEKDSWKIEAVTALLEMFELDGKNNRNDKLELEAIIDKVTRHYRQKN